jgi:hypothetical protein
VSSTLTEDIDFTKFSGYLLQEAVDLTPVRNVELYGEKFAAML